MRNPRDMRLVTSSCSESYLVKPLLLWKLALVMSGFSWKRFTGSPARTALARRVGSPDSPVLALVPAGVNGFGLKIASGLVKFVSVHDPPVYLVGSPACAPGVPVK